MSSPYCMVCGAMNTTAGRPHCNTQVQIISPPPVLQTPYKCPVCDGTKLVSRPPHVAGDQPQWSDNGSGPYPCGTCNGTGVIWGPA